MSRFLQNPKRRDDKVVSLLYEQMSHQCKICGLRFILPEKLDKHLDWHFEKNKKMKEKKKAISRSWFNKKEDWINSLALTEQAGEFLFKPILFFCVEAFLMSCLVVLYHFSCTTLFFHGISQ